MTLDLTGLLRFSILLDSSIAHRNNITILPSREDMQSNTILRDVGNTEKLMSNNNNLNNNGSPGTDIMFQMEDEGLTQLGSVFQSAYQSIVGGGPQVMSINYNLVTLESNNDDRLHLNFQNKSNRFVKNSKSIADKMNTYQGIV
ncbi:hypothetical protein M0804_000651 [Polistes exclamans]|nr:hypothetical protein M0804_000651 [Polistes exclamans]